MPRRRISNAAKRAAGTYRPSTAKGTVELPPGRPRAPAWLEPGAKKEFDRVARALSEAGTLSEAHRSVLVTYAVLWGEFETAHGKIPTARLSEMRRLVAELGISPRSGTVGTPPAPERPLPVNVQPLSRGASDATRERVRAIAKKLNLTSEAAAPAADQPPPEENR
jgi:phage terminase small subunit